MGGGEMEHTTYSGRRWKEGRRGKEVKWGAPEIWERGKPFFDVTLRWGHTGVMMCALGTHAPGYYKLRRTFPFLRAKKRYATRREEGGGGGGMEWVGGGGQEMGGGGGQWRGGEEKTLLWCHASLGAFSFFMMWALGRHVEVEYSTL